MLDCEEVLVFLSLRLDGALGEDEQRELACHLASCEACRALSGELQALHDAMPLMEEEVPEGFRREVMDRIREERGAAQRPERRARRGVWRWGAMAAIFAVVLLGSSALTRLTAGESMVRRASSASEEPRVAMYAETENQPAAPEEDGTGGAMGRAITEERIGAVQAAPSGDGGSPTETDEDAAVPEATFYAADGEIPQERKEQLLENCIAYLQTSDLEIQGQGEMVLVDVRPAEQEELEEAVWEEESLSTPYLVRLERAFGREGIGILCDRDTLNVLGYVPDA